MKITGDFEHVYEGEHGARQLLAEPDAADLEKELRLAFRTPAGKLFISRALTPENGVCVYPLPQELLDAKGTLEAQLHISDENGYYAKSAVYSFPVERALDGTAVPDGERLIALSSLCAKMEAVEARIASITEVPMELVQAALAELQRQTDGFLSLNSENPVQNAVVTAALAQKADKTDAVIGNSVSLGRKENTAVGARSVAAGDGAAASGYASQAFGINTTAQQNYAHAEGSAAAASGVASHAEGGSTRAGGVYAHAEGNGSEAAGEASHAEGKDSYASGNYAHAEGKDTTAGGAAAHAEGNGSSAAGNRSHAEGNGAAATAASAHAEGDGTTASGESSHAEGYHTTASATGAHAEGFASVASGVGAHASGVGTLAGGVAQIAAGKYNLEDSNGINAVIVGGGTADNARGNIGTLDWNGNAWFKGGVKVGGSSRGDVNAKALATVDALNAKADLSALATVATSGQYADLQNKPAIPTVPANVSAFTNDAGYLTAHQSLAGLASEAYVNGQISALSGGIKDRFIVTATWNSTADKITALDIAPSGWELNGGKKELVLRLSDGIRKVELHEAADTLVAVERKLFVGMLPSSSVLGNNNVILNESDHIPTLLYCFMGFDDLDPSGNADVFAAGQRPNGVYVWISKIYRMPLEPLRGQTDAVIENGSSGGWTWRKWSSGKIELRASDLSFEPISGGLWGNGMSYCYSDFTLPVTLANTNYSVFCTRSSGATYVVIGCAHSTGSKFRIALCLPSQNTVPSTLNADLLVLGEWK